MYRIPVATALLTVTALMAQTPQARLNLPYGPITRLASPDGRVALYGVPSGLNTPLQLWIENTRSHERTKLLDIPGTLSAGWSPDGRAFFVLDHRASDQATSYIYDAATLRRLDLAARITASDPATAPFTHGHTYFDADRWEGSDQVLVRLHGHTDTAPVTCFDFRYRVGRDGSVAKLPQHTFPAGSESGCS
jgi:hypothetical protein